MNNHLSFDNANQRELLYFWAIGDMHYRAIPAWNEFHTQRLAPLFEDLHEIWLQEGIPAFCVSPGDLVETGTVENYQVAKVSLAKQLGNVAFYPGIGNHEYHILDEEPTALVQTFTDIWDKPIRYSWQAGKVVCIMLDYPNPATLADPKHIYISQETLAFLDETLTANADRLAVIFLHCPLYNTVLDRDPEQHRDYNSLQNFFSPDNSQEVRAILARHRNAFLYISGHTHSGWEAPNLVLTEKLGEHPLTFVNLMSPWYTGKSKGPRLSPDHQSLSYIPDEPDVVTSFAIRVYHDHATIHVREHLTRQWLKEWHVPFHYL
ncbi:MAG TPA: metallophosphoesterase [Ktedonobacteraceae bacterium]|jgi:hypothetical protein